MHTGHYISGGGHLALIGWVLFGGVFSSEPPPFEMTEVSVISAAEFDALTAVQQPPDSATQVVQPEAPEVTPDEPEVVVTPDEAVEQPSPQQTETPSEDPAPEVSELSPPPDAEVSDVVPELDQPVGDQAALVPEVASEAVPRPVERVAPEAVAQPEPDATPSEVEQAAVAPDETGETTEEPAEAQAPEEATTEIVTETAEAPKASLRPPGKRPEAPAVQVSESSSEEPEDVDAAAIAAAVAAAQEVAEAPNTPTPTGPPLNQGEKDSLKVAVARCWSLGAVSTEALQTIVVVSVQMNKNGTPIVDTMRMIDRTGGSDASANTIYRAARSAIARCGAKGFDLPAEKFSHWQSIEMTFDPRKMGVN